MLPRLSAVPRRIGPHDNRVAVADSTRQSTGRVRDVVLTADPATVDIGGRMLHTWAFNGRVPGPRSVCTSGIWSRASSTGGPTP
jgi:hypothetical protein